MALKTRSRGYWDWVFKSLGIFQNRSGWVALCCKSMLYKHQRKQKKLYLLMPFGSFWLFSMAQACFSLCWLTWLHFDYDFLEVSEALLPVGKYYWNNNDAYELWTWSEITVVDFSRLNCHSGQVEVKRWNVPVRRKGGLWRFKHWFLRDRLQTTIQHKLHFDHISIYFISLFYKNQIDIRMPRGDRPACSRYTASGRRANCRPRNWLLLGWWIWDAHWVARPKDIPTFGTDNGSNNKGGDRNDIECKYCI